MTLPFDVVIPVRYHSTRLPGKALADICGKSLIQRVVECALSSSAERVIVALDDKRVEAVVSRISGVVACRTSRTQPSGTDRVAEAVVKLNLPDNRIIVNVQGDEPLIAGELIDKVALLLEGESNAQVGTSVSPISSEEVLLDPNVVKCIVDQNYNALYFSRSPIPWRRPGSRQQSLGFHHIGIYAYRVSYLIRHAKREVCAIESSERLEQLRMLFHGDRIAVHVDHSYSSFGVDTQEDLEKVRELITHQELN